MASNVTKARLAASAGGCSGLCDSRVSKKVGVEISDDELFTGNHNHYFLPLCSGAGACLTKVASGGNKSKDIVKTETLLPDLFVESKHLKSQTLKR